MLIKKLFDALKFPSSEESSSSATVTFTTKPEGSSGTTVSVGSSSGLPMSPGYIGSPYHGTTIPTPYTGHGFTVTSGYSTQLETKDETISQLIKALNETKLDLLEDIYADLESVTTDIGLINVLSKIKGKITRLKNKDL